MLPSALQERPAGLAKLVAGRLCLDFANSVGGWQAPDGPAGGFVPRDDRLSEYADLLAFALRAGLLDEAAASRLWRESEQRPREAGAVRQRARRLRDAIHALAWNCEHGSPQRPSDLQVLTDEVRVARERERLESADGRLAWRLSADNKALDAVLWPVALSAESYFTSADLTRLHSCPGEDCGWLFEDATRNRSRQWCDMGDCGNVAKLRRFRARQARRKRTRRPAVRSPRS